LYADVALPVPVDQLFTYALPETLQARVQPGCRVLVPFAGRKLAGIAVAVHDAYSGETAAKHVLKLLDVEPVLEPHMIELGRWVARYYCAPIGESLRVIAPVLSGEHRRSKVYALTDAGLDTVRQLLFGADDADTNTQILRLLESRPLASTYLLKKVPAAAEAIKTLLKKRLITVEELHQERDPLRAAAERLRVTGFDQNWPDLKLKKAERELMSFLELHPGTHNLKDLDAAVKGASESARALARRKLLALQVEPPSALSLPYRPPPVLSPPQQETFGAIRASIDTGRFQAFLLHGVTGSGKTEVYLRSIEAVLAGGRSALLLVPEIALTPAMAGQFHHRFGDRVAILHSAFHDAERAEQWRRIRCGDARVVVGTRSGVFAPVQNLGLIIVDEEHDGSYKQGETPRYNGRDVAVMRAYQAGATVVLGSATPSLESRHNVERGKYTMLRLRHRIENRPMPIVELIDMRAEFHETKKQATFSRRLLESLRERLANREQAVILHNRRGFSTFVACRSCGERCQCVNCSVTLTWHRRDRRLLCHYCNYAERVPSVCPKCGSEHIYFLGIGSERVEDELHTELPEARIARLDRDTASGKRRFEAVLSGFREGAYDILVGTQMIAKGHDIPNVTLAAVVNADLGLGMPDFRAAERTFQLLTQVAGRAGRGQLPGQVLVQTINPEHYAIAFAAAHDFDGFYAKELGFRKAMRYPPFAALANVLVRNQKQEEAMRMAGEVAHLLTPPPSGMRILGPAEAAVPRLKDEFRFQLLVKSASRPVLNETLNRLRSFALERGWGPTALVIDVDPLSLL
jgi:primosomal protein N' (replication factor Y)